ncbi:MAG: aminopeptidase [Pseudopedobacter saltans]|uniref:Carboxypeptidase Q n=1 Tax=Pseudopedobacter saltans TaxID=151895 RepID=A0A2W5F6K6_9SPHI|nr:MAG: aminopeptidase [Pseudopedobacter saltans]
MIVKCCFTSLFIFFFLSNISAQGKTEWKSIFEKINTEVLSHSQAYGSLQDATQKIGHRLTGSENGKKAEQYAYDLLKSYGIKDVKFQAFQAESWSRGTISVKIGSDKSSLQIIHAVTLAHSPVKADITADIVDMGNGVEADYIKDPNIAKGKIVLAYLGILPNSTPGTKNLHRSEKTAIATKYGAKGIILINAAPGDILLTGTASVTGKLIPIPAVCIGNDAGLALKKVLKEHSQIASIQMTNHSGTITARNVIATFEGNKLPKEKIVVGGHLDSWDLATGAIDNGIGSFAVMDMARTFQQLRLHPERTVEFVLFMGEEEGLLGSRAYVTQAIKNKNIDQIRYMLNYDMTNDPKSFSSSTVDTKDLFQYIGKEIQTIDTTFRNNFKVEVGLHSDHEPFMLEGIPTGGGADAHLDKNVLDCYHADCDVFDLVDRKGQLNTVRFSTMLTYGLADAVTIPTKRLSDEETKELLIKNNLEEPLKISGDWRWK